MSTFAPYDQYEVSVPLEQAGDCLAEVLEHTHESLAVLSVLHGQGSASGGGWYAQVLAAIDAQQLWSGFRTPGLIRFLSKETGYLSQTSDGTRCQTIRA